MADPVKWGSLSGYHDGDQEKVTIEAICPSGFEEALLLEVKDVFGQHVVALKHQGRVFFDLPLKRVSQVLDLRVVDNAYVIICVKPEFDFSGSSEECVHRLAELLREFQWCKGLLAWNEASKFYEDTNDVIKEAMKITIVPDHTDKKLKTSADNNGDASIPSFRCTCYRSGEKYHSFGSMDAARHVGGTIQEVFGWTVKMKESDIDVHVIIDLSQVYCSIKLTKKSLYFRNITSFGRTTLRATICAGLLKLAKVQPGEIVVDPLSGAGSIPIEGCLSDKKAFYFGGEIHEGAVQKCRENLQGLTKMTEGGNCSSIATGFVQWDATKIPLRDNSVDVFISDLVRSFSCNDNIYYFIARFLL